MTLGTIGSFVPFLNCLGRCSRPLYHPLHISHYLLFFIHNMICPFLSSISVYTYREYREFCVLSELVPLISFGFLFKFITALKLTILTILLYLFILLFSLFYVYFLLFYSYIYIYIVFSSLKKKCNISIVKIPLLYIIYALLSFMGAHPIFPFYCYLFPPKSLYPLFFTLSFFLNIYIVDLLKNFL
jgi:hypothetical protein